MDYNSNMEYNRIEGTLSYRIMRARQIQMQQEGAHHTNVVFTYPTIYPQRTGEMERDTLPSSSASIRTSIHEQLQP